MSHAAPAMRAAPPTSAEPPGVFTRNQRLVLTAIAVVSYFATVLVAKLVGPFSAPGFGGSLLLDANPIISLTMTVVWAALVFLAATFAGRSVRPDVGLFAAAIALFAFRRSGGVARDVYLAQPAAGTLHLLALELLLLGGLFALLHLAVRGLIARKLVRDDDHFDDIRTEPEPLGQKLLAIGTHALVVAVFLLFTLRSDERMQVTAMVAIASIIASICTVRFIPATPSLFFWLGPIVAGVIGYLVTSLMGTANLSIGEPLGYFGPLARALPLDYASAGIAGALYGYWIGRTWIPEDARLPAR